MRKWIHAAVEASPSFGGLMGDRLYTTSTTEGDEGPGDAPETPFAVIRFGNSLSPRMPGSKVRQQLAEVWLHTSPGSMIPTDDLAEELASFLPKQAPARVDGEAVMACEWQFTSGDGYDDHYHTATRYVEVLVTYSAAG